MARRKKQDMVPMSGLFDAVVKKAPQGQGRVLDDAAWRRVVGVNVAKRTRPVRVEGGVLLVRVATSAWAQELSLLKTTLLERIAVEGVTARDVRFVVGPVEPPQRSPEVQARVPYRPKLPLPADLLEEIEKIPDPELRRSLARAAQANLSWQAIVLDPVSAGRRGVRDLRPVAEETARSARSSQPAPSTSRGNREGR